ncbi:MAG: hypothetical protein C5B50_10100 [Verrucomicrobia bacterium]|nr:MAG: hypothetical protein C5B50_10100 [Verrucomicrobiota bacterium]
MKILKPLKNAKNAKRENVFFAFFRGHSVARLFASLALLLLCGCFQVEDEITILADGSGTVKLTVHSNLPEELTDSMGMGGMTSLYPPISESEARQFFPSKDFTLKTEEKKDDNGKTLVIEASFKNINALLASPYARAHQLDLKKNADGSLKFQALSGGSAAAAACQLKPEGELAAYAQMPGFEDAQKHKDKLRFEFRVTLPNPVTQANGARDQKTVIWATERAKCKDDQEFVDKLAVVLEASCGAEGLKFSPIAPPRLGLVSFSQLAAGKTVPTEAAPDTNKISAAARFVPYALHVTRTVDLSGEGAQGSQAELTGAVIMPPDLAPQRWGEAKLQEVSDAKGNNLMPKQGDDSYGGSTRYFSRYNYSSANSSDDGQEEPNSEAPVEKPHVINLSFKAPEWKIKQIAKIKGAIELQYLGGSEIVKISNAVPARFVMDMSKGSSALANMFQSGRNQSQISDARLSELGLSLKLQMAMVQSGMTVLSLETGGKAALTDAQVFDSEGRPWVTSMMQQDPGGSESQSCQIMVAGKPKPPLSMAFAVGGLGAAVNVPILLENVPTGDK